MQPPKYDPRCDAERPRLRGVPESRFEVGAFAALPHLRTCWLLRRLAESTRHQAFSCDRPSDHRRIRSAGRVGMVLCRRDRKSTRLNSSHSQISYAVFCLKKKKNTYHYVSVKEQRTGSGGS